MPGPAPMNPLQASECRAARSPRSEPAPSAQRQAAERRVARCAGALQHHGAGPGLRPRSSPSHPPSSASRSLPRPPCAASRDCCPELLRSLRLATLMEQQWTIVYEYLCMGYLCHVTNSLHAESWKSLLCR
ncbi:vesicle-associated membrane protein 4 isoform X2 [Cricetulus griseus]|uniref:Vesicle-associated membrane protein 4 isoform X2 n=1 Tax=Cricetulus griseus TaxID=10029 RepID=A0A9J7JYJ9_CRIGR|nr:vesicle-associated membrane protein 4 isoform X2 [Cricetulus griseus]